MTGVLAFAYGAAALFWFWAGMANMVREFGYRILPIFPLFLAMSIFWPVLRCREEKETDNIFLKIFA